jgi:hypothetical protein
MTRIPRNVWITGAAAVALLAPQPAAAAPDRPPRPEPDRSTSTVQIVEVPVEDTGDEVAQMVVAAALGAAVAATVARRRRAARSSAGLAPGVIDLTDIVCSAAHGADLPEPGGRHPVGPVASKG